MNTASTLATFQAMFPNAWSEKDNPHFAIVDWAETMIWCGPDDHGQLTLALLTHDEWEQGDTNGRTMAVASAAEALELVDRATNECATYDEMITFVFG